MSGKTIWYISIVVILLSLIYYIAAGFFIITPAKAEVALNGAGSSFAYPLYSTWAKVYNEVGLGKVNYQSIGSGGGIKAIKAGTVDFGATDQPLSVEELKKEGLIEFPTAMGGVVVIYNYSATLPISLGRQNLVDIFSGKLTNWKELGGKDVPITVVHRSDGSGTTSIFTKYLDGVHKGWEYGSGVSIEWPIGVGAKGNEGVGANVQQIPGSIGYVEYTYAVQNHILMAYTQNKSNKDVYPTIDSISYGYSGTVWDVGCEFGMLATKIGDGSNDREAWPIMGATYVVVRKDRPDVMKKVVDFFKWSINHNSKEKSEAMGYLVLPEVDSMFKHGELLNQCL